MRYLALTLDPLHIGAGGYRLGRVDNTIVRDAGSGLPKIPGSSLAGVVRCYASWNLDEGQKACAGDKNCGHCPICTVFGYAANKEQEASHIGLLRFYDGHILAFPVRTMAGPVWVTCPSVMEANGFPVENPGNEELLVNFEVARPANVKETRLNLGWLYLPCRKLANTDLHLPLGSATKLLSRFAIAPDWLFGEIVNSNLEVRTSVRIDPNTGAASVRIDPNTGAAMEGALFTYEAIPQATLLSFAIEIDTYRCHDEYTPEKVQTMLDKALAICASLGMGGMSTRGFGRVRFLETGETK